MNPTTEQLTKAYMQGKVERQKRGEKRFKELCKQVQREILKAAKDGYASIEKDFNRYNYTSWDLQHARNAASDFDRVAKHLGYTSVLKEYLHGAEVTVSWEPIEQVDLPVAIALTRKPWWRRILDWVVRK